MNNLYIKLKKIETIVDKGERIVDLFFWTWIGFVVIQTDIMISFYCTVNAWIFLNSKFFKVFKDFEE